MIDTPKIELKSSISVQGQQNVRDLTMILANTHRTGVLRINLSQGGAVSAEFQEKIDLEK